MVKSALLQCTQQCTRYGFRHWKLTQETHRVVCCRNYAKEASLKKTLAKKVPEEREKMLGLKCLYGDRKIGEIKLANAMGGMRGLMLLLCDTSYVDPNEGISYRGMKLKDVVVKLPRTQKDSKEGAPEGVFWLLASGSMPTGEQAKGLTKEWNKRGNLPRYCQRLLDSMDRRIHPMAQLCAASACLDAESKFVKAYKKGVKKAKYWEYVYEDAMDLCAFMPTIAAIIYCNVFKDGAGSRELKSKLDWTANFCRMIGFKDKNFIDLMRLYLVLHADHESGNVSAHATHLVGSALSSPYLSYSAGMAGLAGPLHGLANQEVLIWLNGMTKAIGDAPKDDEIIKYINDTLKKGRVVPGYGHAVLRKTDPRFELQNEFAMKNCKDDKKVKLVTRLWKIIPEVLKKLGKVANPYPNVDAHSGVLLQYYGLKEMQYYTVLFGVSRLLGVMSQTIWARALGAPIERPKSFTSNFLCKFLKSGDEKKDSSKTKSKK